MVCEWVCAVHVQCGVDAPVCAHCASHPVVQRCLLSSALPCRVCLAVHVVLCFACSFLCAHLTAFFPFPSVAGLTGPLWGLVVGA